MFAVGEIVREAVRQAQLMEPKIILAESKKIQVRRQEARGYGPFDPSTRLRAGVTPRPLDLALGRA